MTCGKCKGPVSSAEYASYGQRCEDCYVGIRPATSGSLPAVLRLGQTSGLVNFPGSGKRQKKIKFVNS